MGTSTEDRARPSQLAVHCLVEEQALVEQGLRWGADTVMRDNELTRNTEAHNASSGLVKDDGSRRGTLRTRDCGQNRDVLHGSGRPARATDPLKNPRQRKNLGQTGGWETIPSDGHPRVRNQEVHS